MVTLRTIEFVISCVTLLIAYLIVETLSGAFRAWTAKEAGDDTAADLGFLTLNPLAHIDPIGMALLFILGFGWGRYVPINFSNIQEPYRQAKILIVYFSDIFAHMVLALIALVALLKIFDLDALYLAVPMIFSGNISLAAFAAHYPHISSLSIAGAIILVAIMYLSVLLAVLNFIMSSCRLVMMWLFQEESPALVQGPAAIIAPMILIFIAAPYLRLYAVYGLIHIGYFLATLMGTN
jgi:hypothetical protein